MNRLEFIGPSGCGKSTILNAVVKNSLTREWRTVEECLQHLCKNLRSPNVESLISHNEPGVIDKAMPRYEELLSLSMNTPISLNRPIVQAQLVRFRFNNLIRKAAIFDLFSCDYNLVDDDGVLHNSVLGLVEQDDERCIQAIKKSGVSCVLHFIVSEEELLRRRKEKIRTGKGTFVDRSLSESDLQQRCQRSLKSVCTMVRRIRSAGLKVIDIDTTGRALESIAAEVSQTIHQHFTQSTRKLEFLTYEDLRKLLQNNPNGHWKSQPLDRRWDYHSKAIELIKKLEITRPDQVLEMGTMGAQIVKGSHTLDYAESWDYKGKNPTYLHDGRIIPWPVPSGKYRVFVALRVFQYLDSVQKEAFLEARRIADHAIISVPTPTATPYRNSQTISKARFTEWNDGREPDLEIPTALGSIYYWDFAKHRTEDITLGRLRSIGAFEDNYKLEVSESDGTTNRELPQATTVIAPSGHVEKGIHELIDLSIQNLKEGKYARAMQIIEEAGASGEKARDLEYVRALCFLSANELVKAGEALKSELQYFPDNRPAHELLESLK